MLGNGNGNKLGFFWSCDEGCFSLEMHLQYPHKEKYFLFNGNSELPYLFRMFYEDRYDTLRIIER